MMILVAYDVETANAGGATRLRRVAKVCERYGIRVQNSVFEVLVDAAQYVALKHALAKEMDEERDSIRFYRLGKTYQQRVESLGKVPTVQSGEPLLL